MSNIRKLYTSIAVFLLLSTLNATELFTPVPPSPDLCCNFEYTPCDLINVDWKWSAEYSPTPYSIPSHDGRFMWTNELKSELLTLPIHVTPITIYSFDYYMETTSNTFVVNFRRASDGREITLFTAPYKNANWYNADIDFSLCIECCDLLTCDGELMIIIEGSDTTFVAGIDNFGRDGTCIQPPTLPPTLPPPVHHSCCFFDYDICNYALFNWKWSAEHQPNYYVPYLSGDFLWTSTLESQIFSAPQINVEYYTRFQFLYYLDSSSNHVYVHFRELVSGETTELNSYYSTSNQWLSVDVACDYDCCTSYPCNGEIIISVSGSDTSFVAAIDSIGRDNSCEENFPCCQFDDDTICDFNSTNDGYGYTWNTSINQYPHYPPPNPGSEYVFFETINYDDDDILEIVLESPTVNIKYNSVFTGEIFARDNSQHNEDTSLIVSFYNYRTEESTLLDFVKETSGSWKNIKFYCESTHGNCCLDDQCTGKIEITAQVGSYGGSILYAINAFEVDNACDNFPNPTSSN